MHIKILLRGARKYGRQRAAEPLAAKTLEASFATQARGVYPHTPQAATYIFHMAISRPA